MEWYEIAIIIGALLLLGAGKGFGLAWYRDWRRGRNRLDILPNNVVDIGGVKWRVMGAEASMEGAFNHGTELRVTFVAIEPHKIEISFGERP